MANEKPISEVQAALATVLPLHGATPHSLTKPVPGTATAMLVPEGMKLQSIKALLDEYADAPERVRGTAKLEDMESFVEYVRAFSNLESKLFASDSGDDGAPSIVAIIDHHGKGPTIAPHFCLHRAAYEFPLSDEWNAWNQIAGKSLPQAAFAAFLEDHLLDVLNFEQPPASIAQAIDALGLQLATPARLVDLAKGLTVRVNQVATNRPNLNTGEVTLVFSEEHKDETGQPLKVPTAFAIGIPVFKNGDLYPLLVRLRYRVDHGKTMWSLDLHRAERVFDDAFRKACTSAKEATGLPLFYGTPES